MITFNFITDATSSINWYILRELLTIVFKILLHLFGLFNWSLLTLLLMNVVICKDGINFNIRKFLNTTKRRRWRIFKRNLANMFFRINIGFFILSCLVSFHLIMELYNNFIPEKPMFWLIFHPAISYLIYKLYGIFGYKIQLFVKFKLFWDNKHD